MKQDLGRFLACSAATLQLVFALWLAPPPGMEAATRNTPCEQDQLELLDIDTLFYIDNRGLTRLFVNLNGYPFKLITDTTEQRQSTNAFLIPRNGSITIDIAAYIRPGEDNCMAVQSQGPPGSTADLVISDVLLAGQQVAYAIRNLQALPERWALLQNYPNPFRDATTIVYEVPESRISGLHVSLALYDTAGRRVRVLVDDWRYPGRFTVDWDGAGEGGLATGSGVYFCLLKTAERTETLRLIRVR